MNRPEAIQLATTALHAAMREDWPAAREAVEELNRGDQLLTAILAWCDTCLASQGIGMDAGRPVQVKWQLDGTGDLQHAGEVSPGVRWAGQLINARAADDEASFRALMKAVPEGAALGLHVGNLLQCIAVTVKATAGAS